MHKFTRKFEFLSCFTRQTGQLPIYIITDERLPAQPPQKVFYDPKVGTVATWNVYTQLKVSRDWSEKKTSSLPRNINNSRHRLRQYVDYEMRENNKKKSRLNIALFINKHSGWYLFCFFPSHSVAHLTSSNIHPRWKRERRKKKKKKSMFIV